MNKLLFILIGIFGIVIVIETIYLFVYQGGIGKTSSGNVPIPAYDVLAEYYKNTLELKQQNILTKSELEREYIVTVVETGKINDDPLNSAYLSYSTKYGMKRFEFSPNDIDVMVVHRGEDLTKKLSFSEIKKGDKIHMYIKNDPYVSPTIGTEELIITILAN